MRIALFGLLLLGTIAPAFAAPPAPIVEGTDYFVIDPPQPTDSGDRIEVLEAFGYSCPHCAEAQPTMDKWVADLPPDVEFHYWPVVWGGVWETFARAYFAAESMGLLDKTHDALFRAVHIEKRPIRSAEDIAKFYADYGVSAEDFLAAMNSFAVNAKIARGKQQLPRYQVEGTPTLIVAGKYRVPAPRAGVARMVEIADQLIQRERAARTGK